MLHRALGRPVPVELTADPRVAGRVRRLVAVSAVVLGLIWALAATMPPVPPSIAAALAAGWLLMPLTLLASLRRPGARYGLVLPSSLVSLALVAICLGWLPADPAAAAGWLLVTAGVLLGGAMGLFLWFHVVPVPAALDDPMSGALGPHRGARGARGGRGGPAGRGTRRRLSESPSPVRYHPGQNRPTGRSVRERYRRRASRSPPAHVPPRHARAERAESDPP